MLHIKKMLNKINRLLAHTLYIRLLILLLCLGFSATLMQAGSLFLLDYIPSNYSAIRYAYEQKIFWVHQLDVRQHHELQGVDGTSLKIQQEQLDKIKDTLSTFNHPLYPEVGHPLSAAFMRLRQVYADFDGLTGEIPDRHFTAMVEAYDQLALALQQDAETKQSVISLLQLMGLFLVIASLGGIAFSAKKLLVERMDALKNFTPPELLSDPNLNEPSINELDEFAPLERLVYEISARLEGFKAENEWFNQTNSERLRRMVRSQDFLYKFLELVSNATLTETALRKILYLLQKALNVSNVALIFTEKDTGISAERMLFSHHRPTGLHEELFDEVTVASFVSFIHENEDGVKSQCLAVGFSSLSGALGVLKIEAEAEHLFDDTEVQLVEVTGRLLSIMMGYQGREQEGRRVALLEERAAIARELHDSLAQSLSFMKIQLSRLQSEAPVSNPDQATREIINELRNGLDNAYRELRELLATFRVHMDVRGLSVAIQSAIDEFMQRASLAITLDNRLVNCRLTVNEEFHILHVIREALSNVVRHAEATNAVVALVLQPSGDMMVTVDDDGIGYAAKDEDADHYGQKIMKERAYSLGGDIAVLRRRTGGTRVRLLFTPKLPQ